jgi:hypothetical protein
MKRARSLLLAVALGLALLVGQQAAARHDLRHAAEDRASHDGVPGSHTCPDCLFCAALAGAIGTAFVDPPPVDVARLPVLVQRPRGRHCATFVAFDSRAPPAA